MTTAVEYKKYRDLLAVLANYYSQSKDELLNFFLIGYAGREWEAERDRAVLPDCPKCGISGTTVHHADSDEEQEILTCANCGHTRYR